MTSGLTTATATSALSRETPTKETAETAETHIEKRLKRLWVRIGETLKQLRLTSAGRWWLVWVSGGRKWVLGSSKATNVACLAVFYPDTNSALSRQLHVGIKVFVLKAGFAFEWLIKNCVYSPRLNVGHLCALASQPAFLPAQNPGWHRPPAGGAKPSSSS
jgi:hypothetical protein